jgi:shikimate kinase
VTQLDRIFLVGAMGAGKSAVGRQLARLLHFDFTDTDHEVETRAGVDIAFIFDKEGESGFRARETQALTDVAARSRLVVATGGGCVVAAQNRRIMAESGVVVYLHASVEQLFERVRYGTHRPLLQTDDPRAALARIVEAREPLYRSLADLVIDTGGRRVHAVARSLASALHRHIKEGSQRAHP